MSESVGKLLEKFISYLENTESFLADQAPDFIQQLAAYYTWETVFNFYCAVGILVISIILLIVSVKVVKKSSYASDAELFAGIGIIVSAVVIIISIFILPQQYSDIKKIELAPKVFLLEKAMELGK